jgi:uncharacterized protein (DUF3084 family)
MKMIEAQMEGMRNGYEEILQQRQMQIDELTHENMQMLNEIEERNIGHQTLEEKLEYVDNEICNLAKQLEHSAKVN